MRDYSADQLRVTRAIESRDLDKIRQSLIGHDRPLTLEQAVDVLDVIRENNRPLFDRAAARWVARLILERDVGIAGVDAAVGALDPILGLDRRTLDELIALPLSQAEAAKPKPWTVPHPSST